MRYIIKGKGGQGVFFLAKIIAQTFLFSGIDNFSFLKEFDEGQRNGEIRITFNLPFNLKSQELTVEKNNMIELRKVVSYLGLDKANVKKAIKAVKPNSFKDNLNIWQYGK